MWLPNMEQSETFSLIFIMSGLVLYLKNDCTGLQKLVHSAIMRLAFHRDNGPRPLGFLFRRGEWSMVDVRDVPKFSINVIRVSFKSP